ncbi:hypothetical protein HY36_11660 [Hyphomonas atlantica]|uniref:Reverse transcriptase domain-containing protein n=3 Tax=Hyphomonadaceae TaxID=69657 RepID=A0A059DWS0_9PROT|nr:hypothetical protein HY36_11660 [Hyphomonas atlantica]
MEKDHGVPRGIGLSALISELAMRTFDQSVRDFRGVYKYYRFADDILVFSTCESSEVSGFLLDNLPTPMTFNPEKSDEVCFPGKKEADLGGRSLDYLGYEFTAKQVNGNRDSRHVRVSISQRKLKKIQSRVILSFKDYARTGDWGLLKDRVKYLSANFRVQRQGAEFVRSSRNVFSGIYFNYPLCGEYQYKSSVMRCSAYDSRELKELDGFYHSMLRKISGGITPSQLLQMKRLSFNKGYELRIRVRFYPRRISEINRGWRNA